jgi:alanine racemase
MTRMIRAVIDTAALQHNLRRMRAVSGARVMAVVKANAYGHGLVQAANALREADALAVARLDEGMQLRAAGIRQPIVVLEGVFSGAELTTAAEADFDLVVHDPEQVRLLELDANKHAFPLWLKIDSGMNRLGFRPESFATIWRRIDTLATAPRVRRVMTHLARADEPDHAMTKEQLARFAAVTDKLGVETSIGNSAGTLLWPEARGNWVRPGLALYGVSPFAGREGVDFGLQSVMTLEAMVIAVRSVLAGETVGYGGAWRAARDSTIAIVAAGYGDGLARQLPSGTPVLVDGSSATLVGRVSMDMIAVDVTELRNVRVGSRAQLWGRDLPVEKIAARAGTIPYELLCGVSQRVPLELC